MDGLFGGAGCRADQQFLAHVQKLVDTSERIAKALETIATEAVAARRLEQQADAIAAANQKKG